MRTGQKQERRVSAARSRAHHISSIAHLFLAEEEVNPVPPPANRKACFCVAGPQPSAVTALVASRLASLADAGKQNPGRTGGATRILLWEDERTAWSYLGYLAGSRLAERGKGQFGYPFPLWPISHWPFRTQDRELLTGDTAAGSFSPTGGSTLIIQHLGQVDECTVRHLQRCVTFPSGLSRGQKEAPGGQNLIWCLVGPGAVSLAAYSRLGRVVDFLGVKKIILLVFPDCWQGLGMPGLRIGGSAEDQVESLDPDQVLKLGRRVAPGREVVVISPAAKPGAGPSDQLDAALTGILAREFLPAGV